MGLRFYSMLTVYIKTHDQSLYDETTVDMEGQTLRLKQNCSHDHNFRCCILNVV